MFARRNLGRTLKFEALEPRLVLDAAVGSALIDLDPAAQVEVGLEDPTLDVFAKFDGGGAGFHVGGGGGSGKVDVGGGGGSGKVDFQDAPLTEYVDKASTPLAWGDDNDGAARENFEEYKFEEYKLTDFKHEDGKHHLA